MRQRFWKELRVQYIQSTSGSVCLGSVVMFVCAAGNVRWQTTSLIAMVALVAQLTIWPWLYFIVRSTHGNRHHPVLGEVESKLIGVIIDLVFEIVLGIIALWIDARVGVSILILALIAVLEIIWFIRVTMPPLNRKMPRTI